MGPSQAGFRSCQEGIFTLQSLTCYAAIGLHCWECKYNALSRSPPPQHQPPFLLPHLLSSSSSPWDCRCVQSSYPSCFSLPLFSLCVFLQTFMLCGSNAVTLRDLSPCRTGVDTPGQLGFHTTGCSVQTFRNNAAPVYTATSSSPCSN